ncbi:MAG: hypothetical protein ABI182_01915 [Candidatus Baltobacteraceae bacterium]
MPKRHNWAVISIGTNSTRYLLTDFSHSTLQASIGTRIGEGLRESGRLGDVPMRRTLDAIGEHLKAIGGRCDHLNVIATSALRRADNAGEFMAQVRELTGATLRILSGEEEARAAFRGAVATIGRRDDQTFGVLDVGGGSTEYAVGAGAHAEHIVSCEIGAVRLTERCLELAGAAGPIAEGTISHAREVVRACLAPIAQFDRVGRLIFVGGSASTTAALIQGGSRLDLFEFSRETLDLALGRLLTLPLEERKRLPGINPQRADILPAGMLILDTVFELTGQSRAMLSLRDLLYGFLLLEREKTRPAQALPRQHR